MQYTCNKCNLDWPKVKPQHTEKSMCKDCYILAQAEGDRRRKKEPVTAWDYEAGFEWLYKSFRGYSVKNINIARKLKGKEAIVHAGCYEERYE